MVLRRDAAVLGLVLLVYGLVLSCSFLQADEDLGGRMAMGRLIVSGREIPRQGVLAYLPTKPLWSEHESPAGLVLLRVLLGLAVLGLAYAGGRLVAGAPLAVGGVSLAVMSLLLQGFNAGHSRPGVLLRAFRTVSRWLVRDPSWDLLSEDDLAALYDRLPSVLSRK